METVTKFFRLTKPGIIQGNALPATAGFLLASGRHVDIGLFFEMLIGLSLVIASACVFNNFIDSDIDKKMARTSARATAQGSVSGVSVLSFAFILGATGFAILDAFTNWTAFYVALTGFVFYVILYGFFKRRGPYGTLIGSVSGAVPPVVGYTAVTGSINETAILLFLILVFWQMPHFYAIAIFREKDYAKAKIPVLPLVRGQSYTKKSMMAYIAAFTLACLALKPLAHTSWTYFAIALVLGVFWLWLGLKGFKTKDDIKWARSMFGGSLLVITILCLVISINALLP